MKNLALTLMASAALSTAAMAQSNITQFNFERVGNFHQYNPAAYQPYRAVVGLPGLSALNITFHNPSFDFNTVLSPEFTANQSIEYVLESVKPGNRIFLEQSSDLMFIGFRTGKGYWSLGAQFRTFMNFEYPIEILRMVYYGPASDEINGQFSMSGNQTQVTSYLNYHLGYQHELLDGKLRVGGRFKWLNGIGHASAPASQVDATLNSTEWNFRMNIRANVAAPLDIENPSNFVLDPMDLLFGDNNGYAFDLGASYEVIDGLEISAAATDFGSITWRTNTRSYVSNGEYTWDGQDYTYGGEAGFNADSIIGDIVEALEFQSIQGEEFTTSLPSNITFNARYSITPKHGFAMTYQLNQWNSRQYNNFGVSYMGNWSKWFSFYASYALVEGDNTNLGVGFSANLGPIQLYMMTDDILLVTGENINMMNLRFGMNVAVFRKDLRGYETEEESLTTPNIETIEQNDEEEASEETGDTEESDK